MISVSNLTLGYLLLEWAIRLVMIVVIPLRRPPEAARSWLLLLLFLPVPALILYHLIGRASFPAWRRERFEATTAARAAIAEALKDDAQSLSAVLAQKLGGFPACDGNSITFITDYEESIAAMVSAIYEARESVHLLTYIFADDDTGQRIAQALARARSRGVAVRVLFDALGSRAWAKRSLAMLRAADAEVHLVLPVRFAHLRRTRSDLRNHRKLCAIDGHRAFVGSQNIVDRDFKPGIVNDELVAVVEGPVVAALDAVFATDWFMETQQALPLNSASLRAVPAACGTARLQAMPSGPDFDVPGFERLLLELIHHARTRITIVSPYLILDEATLIALENAVLRGVRVDIVVSRVVDQKLVHLAQRSYYQRLLEAGIHLHLYRDRLLHAKNVTIDQGLGLTGSSNADMRSFQLNAEITLVTHGEGENRKLIDIQRQWISRSTPLTLEQWRRRPTGVQLLENFARLVSPLL